MNCPRCRGPLVQHQASRLVMNCCHQCGGVFLDGGASRRVVEALDPNVMSTATGVSQQATAQVSTDATIGCPVCNNALERMPIPAANVTVDACREHGIWFDRDELQRVVQAVAPPQQQANPAAPQAYGAPGAPQAYGAPGAPQAYGAPGAPQAYGAPGAPPAYGAPGAPPAYGAPPAPPAYGAPPVYAPNAAPPAYTPPNPAPAYAPPAAPPPGQLAPGMAPGQYVAPGWLDGNQPQTPSFLGGGGSQPQGAPPIGGGAPGMGAPGMGAPGMGGPAMPGQPQPGGEWGLGKTAAVVGGGLAAVAGVAYVASHTHLGQQAMGTHQSGFGAVGEVLSQLF